METKQMTLNAAEQPMIFLAKIDAAQITAAKIPSLDPDKLRELYT